MEPKQGEKKEQRTITSHVLAARPGHCAHLHHETVRALAARGELNARATPVVVWRKAQKQKKVRVSIYTRFNFEK